MDKDQNLTPNPSNASGPGPTPDPNTTPVSEPSTPATPPVGAPPPSSPLQPQPTQDLTSTNIPTSSSPTPEPSTSTPFTSPQSPNEGGFTSPNPATAEEGGPTPQSFEPQEDEPGNSVGPEDIELNSPVIATPPKKSKTGLIAGISAILLLVISVPLGIILVNQQQEIREKASGSLDCKNVKAADGQSLDDPANIGAKPSFEGSYGTTACQKWVDQHNLAIMENCEKAKCSINASDGQSLDNDQNKGARPAFCEQAKYDPDKACQLWVNQHNSAIAQSPSPTPAGQAASPSPTPTGGSTASTCANTACTAKADDGQSLDDPENKGQKDDFCGLNQQNATQTCQAWVNQHNKEITEITTYEYPYDKQVNPETAFKNKRPANSAVMFCVKQAHSRYNKLELTINGQKSTLTTGTKGNKPGLWCKQYDIPASATQVTVSGKWIKGS